MSAIKKSIKRLLFRYRKMTAPWRKMPHFIIIGTQKGGTSSLFFYLNQHPSIKMSTPKEVHYYDINYKKGLNWYKSHFPFIWDKRITGEASPYYIFHPFVPERLKKENPEAKIILLLRDPAERAFSHYKMNKKNGTETLSFSQALEQETERLEGDLKKFENNEFYNAKSHRLYSYKTRGLYDYQLQNWLKYFPLNQIMIIKSEDFFSNTEKVVKEVLRFLGLQETAEINYINKNKGVPGEFDEEIRTKLKNFYAPHIEMLSELAGKKISW
jgi:hypothetical protein